MDGVPVFRGDSRWLLIHTSCYNEDVETEEIITLIKLTLLSLGGECSDHVGSWITNNPIKEGCFSRFIWSVDLHNHINKILHKPEVTHRQALRLYKIHQTTCKR